jgi:hypothetical protein
MIDL